MAEAEVFEAQFQVPVAVHDAGGGEQQQARQRQQSTAVATSAVAAAADAAVEAKYPKTRLHGDKIFTVTNLLSAGTCAALVGRGGHRGWQKSSVSGGGHGRTGLEDPVTNSFVVLHDPALAGRLWDSLVPHLPPDLTYLPPNPYFSSTGKGAEWTPVGVHPKLRLYRYNPGEVFPEHIDYKLRRESVDAAGRRHVFQTFNTVLVYLNENFQGGETGYWPDHHGIHCRFMRDVERQHPSKKVHQLLVTPRTGLCVVQDQNILHEALPPSKGTKYILRTDVVYERVVEPHPKLLKTGGNADGPREGKWERLFEASCKNYAI